MRSMHSIWFMTKYESDKRKKFQHVATSDAMARKHRQIYLYRIPSKLLNDPL